MNENPLPLAGLTVIAVEQAVAAPFASSRLADAGARVIKVERPEGDFARGYDSAAAGQSSYFVWLNRGKESVTLDLSTQEGKSRLEDLVGQADILVQNLKRGALEKLGFGLDRLRAAYPRLITCSISGYGEHGPMADRKAYDLLVQADSGLCSITGGPSEPARVGISVVDIATGATAYSAILEAVIQRSVTGRGSDIAVSLFDVMADWLTVPLLNHEAGQTPRRAGMAHPSIAPYGVFKSSDDCPILISIQSNREWERLCAQFIGEPALADDERFASNVARVNNRDETDALVSSAFATRTAEEATRLLLEAEIAFALVNEMDGLSKHPHLRRIEIETPNGVVTIPSPGPIFDRRERAYGAVPALAPNEEEG